ncbi:MAG: hypothetical protein QGI83_08590 [Candidatus Latescibacteria bacterium]|nr:hypothetical protein [Candidatus Latescibacterota bacterium]
MLLYRRVQILFLLGLFAEELITRPVDLGAQPRYELRVVEGDGQGWYRGKPLPNLVKIEIRKKQATAGDSSVAIADNCECNELRLQFWPLPDGKASGQRGPFQAQPRLETSPDGSKRCVATDAWKLSDDLGNQYMDVQVLDTNNKGAAQPLLLRAYAHQPPGLTFAAFFPRGELVDTLKVVGRDTIRADLERVNGMFGVEYPIIRTERTSVRLIGMTSFGRPGRELYLGLVLFPFSFWSSPGLVIESPVRLSVGAYFGQDRPSHVGLALGVDGTSILPSFVKAILPSP